jgi:hypothetical protein
MNVLMRSVIVPAQEPLRQPSGTGEDRNSCNDTSNPMLKLSAAPVLRDRRGSQLVHAIAMASFGERAAPALRDRRGSQHRADEDVRPDRRGRCAGPPGPARIATRPRRRSSTTTPRRLRRPSGTGEDRNLVDELAPPRGFQITSGPRGSVSRAFPRCSTSSRERWGRRYNRTLSNL